MDDLFFSGRGYRIEAEMIGRGSPQSVCWRPKLLALAVVLSPASARVAAAQATVAATAEYRTVAAELERFIGHEMADKQLPAISIALVDGQRTVWARGFGIANPSDGSPATAETIYRVGSVSKLFTDVGIMQLAERGTIDIDAPVSRYVPDFHPKNPFGTRVTLRQLMSHRSGLTREPPIGSYFDSTSPPLDATVRSLSETTLLYPPGTRTKYSNGGIAVVGYVLQVTQKEKFAQYLARAVLAPLGMTRSSFETPPASAAKKDQAAIGYMWTTEGRRFEAPTFQLGIQPAGSLYTTVNDLARFMSALFRVERGTEGGILSRASLQRMWQPQFATPASPSNFGIGFVLSKLDGHNLVGHNGAVYGFATQLEALPNDSLGVVVVSTLDMSNTVTGRVADEALRLMLAARAGKPLPELPVTFPVPAARIKPILGHYGSGTRAVDLIQRDSELVLRDAGGLLTSIRLLHDTLIVDDRRAFGARIRTVSNGIILGRDTLVRTAVTKPPPPAKRLAALVGEYGWDYDILYVSERDGKLYATIEWLFSYPLEELAPEVFSFPKTGLYDSERVTFTRDARGKPTQIMVGGVVFPRRSVGPESGTQLRITPLRPVAELRREALAAKPPKEPPSARQPDLVELVKLDPSIKLEIRYATANNFLGTPVYSQARAFMQRPAAEALVRVSHSLHAQGFGLLVHDAYRPWYVTKIFWDATPADKKWLVANPAEGSKHNRGSAVDLTLYDLETGQPVEQVSTYDESTTRAYADYPGGTSVQRWHRAVLRAAMEAQGFDALPAEWWHFDHRDWRQYPITNITFDKIYSPNRNADNRRTK